MTVNAVMFSDEFVMAKQFSDLDAMWDIVHKIMVFLAGGTFKKKWFRSFDCVFNKISSWFHKLELLVSKLVKASRLDSVDASPVRSLFFSGAGFDVIHSGLAKVRKSYHSSKLLESKHAEESSVRQAIEKRMESFEVDKSHTIRNVLERLFHKVVLDHLVDGGELVLEPELVKSKMDRIMEGWTKKHVVVFDISGDWARQFLLLDHVFNGVFSDIIHLISFDEMFGVISNLPNGKAAGLSAGLTSFLAAGAFVDNTIWVGSSQAATQHILNVASKFFHLNNISINNDKTVTIPINCQVTAPYLTISGMPIFIAKKGEPHRYLGIFLSSDGLSKPSLVKAHLDVRFFVNLILKKVISDKQFAYLVSLVLFPIVSYRTQFSFIPLSVYNKWDALIHESLKSKSGLPLNFPNDALHHLSLYNFKTFEQIQAESKLASVIAFVNSVGILNHLFSYKSHDLQVLNWCPRYSLLFSVCVRISPSNNFLVSVVCIFSGCDLSLGGFLAGAFRLQSSTPMSLVLASYFGRSSHEDVGGSSDICQSLGFGVICNDLLSVSAACLSVYTDGSLSNLGIVNMLADAVVFFKDIDLGLGVGVFGLVSSTLAELQAIALALKCVPSFHSVDLFSDSQVAINACRLESLSVGPNFRNCCWIEHCHIANIIHHKNLDVNWIKVKGHSGVSSNKHADTLAKNAALSAWHLFHLVSERFLKAGVDTIFGNSRHFVHDIFRSIYHAHWKIGSGSQVVPDCLHADIDWLRSSLVWHLDSHMATGFTSIQMAGFHTYFMKALHHCLLVAVGYPSVVCLFCGEVEVLDHVFSCSSDTDSHANLLDTYAAVWELLSTCISDVTVSTALCKDFVFSNWYCKSVFVYKDSKVAVVNVVNFVQKFCLAFHNNIWLVRVKHRVIMEKNKLIPCDGSIPVAVSGFSVQLLAGVIRLLGVADTLGISFGYCKCCLFYADVGNMTSVHIST
ncbi:hypothetical protein G9A89_016797 [Geosiphon pyriformis]|nr:hypothetical protein G9A89_016797 [Geosiphon pyriformis]